MRPIRVLIADDYEIVRRGLRALLENETDFELCAEARDGREAVEMARVQRPAVAILDLRMPNVDGITALKQIRAELPETEVMVLTVDASEEMIAEALRSGARGLMLKSDAGRDLVTALRAVARREPFYNPNVTRFLVQRLNRPVTEVSAPVRLTAREQDVLRRVVEGHSNVAIAEHLGLSPKTVETHRANLMKKLNAHSVIELVRYAIRTGVISP